jgi:hypothetical protein
MASFEQCITYTHLNINKYQNSDLRFIRTTFNTVILTIQGVHQRMARFQKLTRNLFLTLHGHNVHRQQRQLSNFLMR